MPDLSRILSPHAQAMAAKTEHMFVPGVGHIRAGALPMPTVTINPESKCLPPEGTEDGAMMWLITPGGDERKLMRWEKASKQWAPISPMQGHRIAYTAAYLAAYGWKVQV
jgi:hypothetical protein